LYRLKLSSKLFSYPIFNPTLPKSFLAALASCDPGNPPKYPRCESKSVAVVLVCDVVPIPNIEPGPLGPVRAFHGPPVKIRPVPS